MPRSRTATSDPSRNCSMSSGGPSRSARPRALHVAPASSRARAAHLLRHMSQATLGECSQCGLCRPGTTQARSRPRRAKVGAEPPKWLLQSSIKKCAAGVEEELHGSRPHDFACSRGEVGVTGRVAVAGGVRIGSARAHRVRRERDGGQHRLCQRSCLALTANRTRRSAVSHRRPHFVASASRDRLVSRITWSAWAIQCSRSL